MVVRCLQCSPKLSPPQAWNPNVGGSTTPAMFCVSFSGMVDRGAVCMDFSSHMSPDRGELSPAGSRRESQKGWECHRIGNGGPCDKGCGSGPALTASKGMGSSVLPPQGLDPLVCSEADSSLEPSREPRPADTLGSAWHTQRRAVGDSVDGGVGCPVCRRWGGREGKCTYRALEEMRFRGGKDPQSIAEAHFVKTSNTRPCNSLLKLEHHRKHNVPNPVSTVSGMTADATR